MRKEIETLLKKAYLKTAEEIEKGYKILPTVVEPIWNKLKECYEVFKDHEYEDMYYSFIYAAAEYNQMSNIGIDNAFSTVVDMVGIDVYSADWYKVMSYHYSERARDVEFGFQDYSISPKEMFTEFYEDPIEPDGLELKPGNPEECPGNGKHPIFECRCENCDYFQDCFKSE